MQFVQSRHFYSYRHYNLFDFKRKFWYD